MEPRDIARLLGEGEFIGIDGWYGAGKTYLAESLAQAMKASRISLDDFLERHRDKYVDALRLDELIAAVRASPRPVLVEGACLREVMDRGNLVPDSYVYLKVMSKHGDWRHANECDVRRPINEVLQQVDESILAMNRVLGDSPCGMSGALQEIIRYHHRHRPWEGALVVTRVDSPEGGYQCESC